MTKKKVFKASIILLVILGILFFLPLPIPRIQTMTGTCLRHGETAEVKLYALELRYLFRDPEIHLLEAHGFLPWGNGFRVRIDGEEERFELPGGDGPKLHDYPVILEDGSQSAPGQFRDFSVYRFLSIGQSAEIAEERYHVITDAGFDRWVMEQHFTGAEDEAEDGHLLAVSKDGDTEAVCQEMAAVIEMLER